jgi:hypothetical protein
MKPRYTTDYIDRVYYGENMLDLWTFLTTLELHRSLPEGSWLFCRLVEWISSTRSGVWTYYEAMKPAEQSRISAVMRQYPRLKLISEHYDLGMTSWTSPEEIGRVDRWVDSSEPDIHSALMDLARDEKHLVTKLNLEP